MKVLIGIALLVVLLVGFIYGLLVSAEQPKHLSE